jgi:hypothetical protein
MRSVAGPTRGATLRRTVAIIDYRRIFNARIMGLLEAARSDRARHHLMILVAFSHDLRVS